MYHYIIACQGSNGSRYYVSRSLRVHCSIVRLSPISSVQSLCHPWSISTLASSPDTRSSLPDFSPIRLLPLTIYLQATAL